MKYLLLPDQSIQLRHVSKVLYFDVRWYAFGLAVFLSSEHPARYFESAAGCSV